MENMTPLHIAKFWMNVKIDLTSKVRFRRHKYLGRCWAWNGSLFTSGYGRFNINKKTYRAHRIAYYLCNGLIPKDKFICHRCDNPKCVNPQHLFAGTPLENTQDRDKKDRRKDPGKHKKNSSSYWGVYLRKAKKTKRWRVVISHNYKQYRCGEFETEIEAARAYDAAVKKMKLKKELNFRD